MNEKAIPWLAVWGLGLGTLGIGLLASWLHADGDESSPPGVLEGLCEASAIIPHDGGFLVGDNEAEDVLFRFDASMRLLGELPLPHSVEDIEALAETPGGLIVVGSHSRSKRGEERPERHALLFLETGRVVRADLAGCPACVRAAALAPKEGGVSIEGAAWWRDTLWLGMRSPLEGGKALLLGMRDDGDALRVGEVVEVDLGGGGVRDLTVQNGGLVILAGPTTAREQLHRLYRLAEPSTAPELVVPDLPPTTEGLAWLGSRDFVTVADGDGKPGKPCRAPATWARGTLP